MDLFVVKHVTSWITRHSAGELLGSHVRIRGIAPEAITGKRPVVEHVPRRDEGGAHLHPDADKGGHPLFDEYHAQHHDGSLKWEADGPEVVVEYEFSGAHALPMLEAARALEEQVERDGELEIDLAPYAETSSDSVKRALCNEENGHHRCHLLAHHAQPDHHHHGGKVWAAKKRDRVKLPPTKG